MDAAWIDKARLVDKGDEVHAIDGWLNGDSAVAPVIADRRRPYAIVHTRSILGKRLAGPTHLHKVAWPVPVLTTDDTDDEVIHTLAASAAPYLPVCHGGTLAGVVHAKRVAGTLRTPTRFDATAVVLAPDAPMALAAHAFAGTIAGQLPIVDGRRVVGVLRRQAMLRFQALSTQPRGRKDAGGEPLHLADEPVSGHMDVAWASCSPLGDVNATVQEHGYAIVIEGGLFQGMVTALSTLRAWVDVHPQRLA